MSYTLKTERLTAKISSAGEAYTGRRFDWSGAVAQVELDGCHRFCRLEQVDPGERTSGGYGMMAEFYYPEAYNAASPGEEFLKPGIGVLLKRQNDSWNPYGQYPPYLTVTRGERATDERVVFEAFFTPGWNGYAYRITREIWLEDTTLSIRTTMDNLGEKPLQFPEYNHNFVSPNCVDIGPGVTLKVPGATYGEVPAPLTYTPQGEDALIGFSGPVRQSFFVNTESLAPRGDGAIAWEMTADGVGLRERISGSIARIGLWGVSHTLTPEVFVTIDIAPGQTQVWTRAWDFFKV